MFLGRFSAFFCAFAGVCAFAVAWWWFCLVFAAFRFRFGVAVLLFFAVVLGLFLGGVSPPFSPLKNRKIKELKKRRKGREKEQKRERKTL